MLVILAESQRQLAQFEHDKEMRRLFPGSIWNVPGSIFENLFGK